jgi:hypothetical protein
MVIVDGMHNIFEDLVQYHCWEVLGINRPEVGGEEEKQVDPQKLELARKLFAATLSRHSLECLTIPVLKALCSDNKLAIPVSKDGKRLKKKEIVDLLEGIVVNSDYCCPSFSLIVMLRGEDQCHPHWVIC